MLKRLGFVGVVVMGLGLGVGGGCSSTGGSGSAADEQPAKVFDIKEGMTRDEVVAMYEGEPNSKTRNSDGSETWTYHTNAGEAWIPFNYGYRPEYHRINFSPDGIVTSYSLED